MYAVVRDGVCLAEEFVGTLRTHNTEAADDLMFFIEWLSREHLIRQAYLRPERPELGVFAMYNHAELPPAEYNPSRLLCSYVNGSNRVLVLGSGFLKARDEPIQSNSDANNEAEALAQVVKELNERIDTGEILVVGSELIGRYGDSLDF